jgi:hypothetical protein
MERIAKIAVIVVDESGCDQTREAQKEVLFWANMYGHKIALVEFDNSNNAYPSITTDPKLANLAPKAPIFTKTQANGFIDTGLEDWLKAYAPSHVIVMGMETNCCVKALVLGGWAVTSKAQAVQDKGLVGRGYIVMSMESIMHNDPPDWAAHAKVEIYPKFEEND